MLASIEALSIPCLESTMIISAGNVTPRAFPESIVSPPRKLPPQTHVKARHVSVPLLLNVAHNAA